jgi:hypothetical protein
MSIKLYNLMGGDVVQCGIIMPKAEEPAAWVLIEVCVSQSEKTWIFIHRFCVNVNIACRSLSVRWDFSEITDKDIFQHKRFYNWLVWTKVQFVWQYLS